MIKMISIILLGLILCPNYYAQQKIFGYKISGNGDIVSDVFRIQDGFVLDSANVSNNNKTYKFEYDKSGRLKRDINFITYKFMNDHVLAACYKEQMQIVTDKHKYIVPIRFNTSAREIINFTILLFFILI